jgi:filamentous hemagglutinin family protein
MACNLPARALVALRVPVAGGSATGLGPAGNARSHGYSDFQEKDSNMRNASLRNARPRPLHFTRLIGALAIALTALPIAAFAHQGVAHETTAASADAPSAAAQPMQVEGRVGAIVVTNRLTGRTQRYAVLQPASGDRFLLRNADALPEGASVVITGRADGQVLYSETVRSLASAPAMKAAVQRSEVTGTLRMFHIDYTGKAPEYGYSLISDTGRTHIVDLGVLLPTIDNGMRATVSGPVDANGYVTVDTIEILAPPTPKPPVATSGTTVTPQVVTTPYIALPLKYPNNAVVPYTYAADPFTIASITTSVFGAAGSGSAAEYYKEVSFGAQLLSGLVASVPVTGAPNTWLKATALLPSGCSSNAELDAILNSIETQSAAAAKAANAAWDPANFTGNLYIVNSLPSCGWAGLGYIGWEHAYTNGTAALWVVGHEMGHNFGLYHAGSLRCASGVVIAASGCSVTEYGDPFVIMGNNQTMHFSASQKAVLGYIPGGVSTFGGGTQTYTLGPIELPGQAKYAIQIPTSSPNRTYWVEFRQPVAGVDSGLNTVPTNGAQVRVSYPFENQCSGCSGKNDDTQFLDMTPANNNFSDGALLVGQSWTDPLYNITISVDAFTASALTVTVTSGGVTSTTTTLASSVNPSTFNQSVTFTASVAGNGPTGTVAFTESGTALAGCSAVALTGSGNTRTATCTNTTLAVGTHSIVAAYGGDAGNGTSASAALSQSVKAATTTTLASSANPVTAGIGVTFTATVNGSAPTGTVAFTSDGTSITGCTAIGLAGAGNSRTAACVTSALVVGTHSIVASYAGNSANGTSTSAALSQVVNGAGPAATTTALASNANPVSFGAPVTFTALVTGNAPTGNVAFAADGTGIIGCSAIALSGSGNSRTAACTTSALAVGTRAIVASYAGNGSNATSASATLSQIVVAGASVATITAVTSAANPSPAGASVTLTATIASSPPVAGGTVGFTANGAPLPGCGSLPLIVAGNTRTAVCVAAALASGAYSIVATYSGDVSGAPSVSKVFSQVVPFASIGNTIQFAASDYVFNETANLAAITVTRIGDVSAAASATYTTTAGTAVANGDYGSSSGNLTWAARDSSPRVIEIIILNDTNAEPAKTFTVSLGNPAGATLGATNSAVVTIMDDESAVVDMPGVATVVQHPYGTLSVTGGTLNGNTISNLAKNAVIQLGSVAGTLGSFAKIDFQGFDIGAGNTLTIRAGAPGQTVYLTNVNGVGSTIAGTLLAQGDNGAPVLIVQNANGMSVNAGGIITAPAGLKLDTLGATIDTGQAILNLGTVDGGPSLQLFGSKVNGGGAFKGNAIALATFGNLNNPVNGSHFLANGLQLFSSGAPEVNVSIAGYGSAPQFMNLMVNGNATFSMPSVWPNGSPLPPNNRPAMPGAVRAAGAPDPAYGGGSIILQATGVVALDGGASGDFVFPGGLVFKAGLIDVKGTSLDNAWTTSGAPFQGVFLEAGGIFDSFPSAHVNVRTNDLNWANFSVRPLVPVSTWTLQRLPDGTAQFQASDSAAPHLNFFSVGAEAGAAGLCYPCLANPQVIDFATAP